MTTVDLDPILLAILLLCGVLILGLCCSCVQTSKKTAKYLSKREHEIQDKLKHIKDLSEDEADSVLKEYEDFQALESSKSYVHLLLVDPADSIGESINNSRLSFIWGLFVNETFIGKFFTQEVVGTPIKVICTILGTTTSFLTTNLVMRWVQTHDAAQQDAVLQEVIVLILVFTIVFSTFSEMLYAYIRAYQSDITSGKNLAELEEKKKN